jgi:hypothetical protein
VADDDRLGRLDDHRCEQQDERRRGPHHSSLNPS